MGWDIYTRANRDSEWTHYALATTWEQAMYLETTLINEGMLVSVVGFGILPRS